MARRAEGLNRELQKDSQAIILCGGDFFGEKGILEMYRGKFLAGMMMKMGYTAVAVGENELNYQGRAIMESNSEGLPVICANLFRDGVRIFPPYKIIERRGNRIGIFALLDHQLPAASGFILKPPVEQGKAAVRELREEGCNIVILLAHMNRDKVAELATAMQGIDVIIRGHARKRSLVYNDCSDRSVKSFEDLGVPILFAGDKGRLIGKAVLLPFEETGCMLTDTTVIHLDSSFEARNRYTAHMNEFLSELARKRSILDVQKNVIRDRKGNIKPRYLGLEICGRCHSDVVRRFVTTAHFKAYDRVENEDDISCLKCHTTGYGRHSGFGSEEAAENGVNLKGVSCEACHGPGSEHSRDGEYIKTARNACYRCHTAERSPDFDYGRYLKKACSIMRTDSASTENGEH